MMRKQTGCMGMGRNGAWAAAVALAAVVALVSGCNGQQRTDGDDLPSFTEIRDRYNARTSPIEQIHARTNVEVRWVDERGRRQFEQGDGPLFVRKPSELGLAIGKFNNTMYWVGGDAERFWFFDLNPPDGEPRTATVGRHEDVALAGADEVPIPVRSDQLVHLLGVAEMPESAGGESPRVTYEDGAIVVTLAAEGEGEGEAFWRYELDPANYLPRRISLLDGEGEELVASALSRYHPLQREGVPPGGWPDIPTRIEITTPATERTRLTIFLERDPPPTDGKARDRVRDVHFDFERLVEMLDPEEVRLVEPQERAAR